MNMKDSGGDAAAPRVAVFGEWGGADLGQWAIHRGVIDYLAPLTRGVDTYQCGALRPFDDRQVPAPEHRRARWLSALALPWSGTLHGLRRALRGMRQELLIRRLMPSLAETDLICVGGGGLLTDGDLHYPQSLYVIAAAAAELRKPLWSLGCGADEPWSEKGREMITYFLEACDLIATRDRATAERVAAVTGRRVPVFGDFALPARRPPQAAPASSLRLAVNAARLPPPWTRLQYWYEEALQRAARRYIETTPCGGVTVFTTGAAQDDAPAQRLRQRLPAGTGLCRPRTLAELERLLQDSAVVVASRLYAAILALAAGRPVVGVSSSAAVANFFGDVGLGAYHLRIPGGTAADLVRMLDGRDALAGQAAAVDLAECRAARDHVATLLWRLCRRSQLAS